MWCNVRRRARVGLTVVLAWTLSICLFSTLRTARAQENNPGAQDSGDLGKDASGKASSTRRGSRQTRTKSSAARKTRSTTSKKASPTSKTGGSSTSGISFRQDIAPILVANCVECHTPGRPGLDKGKLDMTSFAKLMQGTPREKVIEPGKPDDSHLVLRIKGDEEPRMPQGGNNNGLSAEAITRFEQWIKAGARLDAGLDPKAALDSYALSPEEVRKRQIASMSPKDRQQRIETTGRERWKKTNPGLTPEIIPGSHFVLFHNLPKDRATNLAKGMENEYSVLKRVLGESAISWGEKVGIYVFNSPKDFIEFARTIENREIDASVVSSGRLAIPEPYIAVVDPQEGKKDEPAPPRRRGRGRRGEEKESTAPERTLAGLLTEKLGESAVLAVGKSPRWLGYGVGSFLASRVEPRSPHYQDLRTMAGEKFRQGWETKATEVLGESDQVSALEARGVGFAIVEALLMSPDLHTAFPAFAHGMSKGSDKLDDVLRDVYQSNREEFLARTGNWVSSRYGREP